MSVAESFTTVRWRCPHCRRSWSSKARANEHVAVCWRDPTKRACLTCKHHQTGYPGGYEEPPHPEECEVSHSFPDGHVFLNRYGEPLESEEEWWPQTDCPLWEPWS